jgi:hypothetical protein
LKRVKWLKFVLLFLFKIKDIDLDVAVKLGIVLGDFCVIYKFSLYIEIGVSKRSQCSESFLFGFEIYINFF